MSEEKLKPYEVIFNQVDPENPSSPVMTSKIIYGTDMVDAIVMFQANNKTQIAVKKIEEFNMKKSGARLKW